MKNHKIYQIGLILLIIIIINCQPKVQVRIDDFESSMGGKNSIVSIQNFPVSIENNTIIGLTSKDISVTKGNIADYGVMGLGYRPGNACVASNFRLSKSGESQFYKIALHELGHLLLPLEGVPIATIMLSTPHTALRTRA